MKFTQNNRRQAGVKLTPADVVAIRRKYESRAFSQGSLAREYGVSLNTIGKIVRWEAWQDLVPEASDESLEAMAARIQREAESQTALARLSRDLEAAKPIPSTFVDESLRELTSPEALERLKTLKGERDANTARPSETTSAGGPGGTEPDPGYE